MTQTKYIILLMTMVIAFELFGCRRIVMDKAMVRYQQVAVPGYDMADYEHLLGSPNSEIEYNAICNLIPYASKYAKYLAQGMATQGKRTENLEKFKNAGSVFDTIFTGLKSHDESIKAASLIFIAEASTQYPNRKELLGRVLKVNATEKRTRYEQLQALINLSDRKTSLDPDLINNFLNSRSWLIKSMTFVLLGQLKSDDFHPILVKEYRNAAHEFDRLLIVNIFKNGFGAAVFDLLSTELETSRNNRLKTHCAGVLKMHHDESAVGQWLVENHTFIDDETLKVIMDAHNSELAHTKGKIFFGQLLDSNQPRLVGMMNADGFFKNLYDQSAKQEASAEIAAIERAVDTVGSLSGPWKEYKDRRKKAEQRDKEKKKREKAFKEEILPKYNAKLTTFIKESEKLFAEGGMNPEEIEDATKTTKELLKFLQEEETKK